MYWDYCFRDYCFWLWGLLVFLRDNEAIVSEATRDKKLVSIFIDDVSLARTLEVSLCAAAGATTLKILQKHTQKKAALGIAARPTAPPGGGG